MSGISELKSQRGTNDDNTDQYGTFHDRLIRSKRYYDNLTIRREPPAWKELFRRASSLLRRSLRLLARLHRFVYVCVRSNRTVAM